MIFDLSVKVVNGVGRGGAYGVGEGDGGDTNVFEPVERVLHNFGAPWLVVRIAEGHGDIDDEVLVGSFGFTPESFGELAGFFAVHVGVGAAEVGRDGIGIADGGDARSGEGAFKAFFVHDDANDFRKLCFVGERGEKLGHDVFAVGHLLDVLGGDEADRINMAKAGGYQFFQVSDFAVRGNKVREALPGVAWAFDELNVFGHSSYLALKTSRKAKI